MATVLKKAVIREIAEWKRKGLFGLGHGGGGRNLILTLEPGNIISFREKGLRKVYDIDVENVFHLAVRRTLLREEEEKRKAKKDRKRLRAEGR